MAIRVFLGGTYNSTWRDELIPLLKIDYFNPIVKNWTSESQAREVQERELCDYCLYVITPEMTGVYSIAEAVDDSNKWPEKTIFAFIGDFDIGPGKSLEAVQDLIGRNGGTHFDTLNEIADYLNSREELSPDSKDLLTALYMSKYLMVCLCKFIRDVGVVQAERILNQMKLKIMRTNWEFSTILQAFHIPKTFPELVPSFLDVLEEIPADKRPTPLTPFLLNETWATDLLVRWEEDENSPKQLRRAISASKRK